MMKKIPVRHLSTTPQRVSAGVFKIRRVEDIVGDGLVHHLHRHDFYFILALQKAKGLHEIDFIPYKNLQHSVFFLRPGQVHRLELKAGSTGYLVEFDTAFYSPKDSSPSQRLRKASSKNYCQLEMKRLAKLERTLAAMLNEYSDKEESYQDAIKALLDIFFIELIRQSPSPKAKPVAGNTYMQERFEEFLELLEKNVVAHKQASHYADVMRLSAYQLNEITKASVGKPVSELINEHILLEAKRHLLATPMQVKEIAGQLGYEDASYFIRFFKKHTGQSPETFRNSFK